MREDKVEEACAEMRQILGNKLTAEELLDVILQLTYEAGMSIYRKEGGTISGDAETDIHRIAEEIRIAPSLGKALIMQSEALRAYYLQYLHPESGCSS